VASKGRGICPVVFHKYDKILGIMRNAIIELNVRFECNNSVKTKDVEQRMLGSNDEGALYFRFLSFSVVLPFGICTIFGCQYFLSFDIFTLNMSRVNSF
jgi:hypothetical protein